MTVAVVYLWTLNEGQTAALPRYERDGTLDLPNILAGVVLDEVFDQGCLPYAWRALKQDHEGRRLLHFPLHNRHCIDAISSSETGWSGGSRSD